MKIFITLLAIIILFANYRSTTFAQVQSQSVDATIRIAVCGDGVAEYPEECDNDDLAGETCHSQGYQPGILDCDIACDLDTSGCGPPLPTPTPSPTPTSVPGPTSTPGPEPTGTPAPSPTEGLDLTTRFLRRLPNFLTHLDLNRDGRITIDEIFGSAKLWAEATRSSNIGNPDCDLNNDGFCNLVDFSILMYYVEN